MWQEDLAVALNSAKPSERKHIMAHYEEQTGLNRVHLYREAGKYGFNSGRKKRCDAGVLKSGLTDLHVDLVAGLIYETRRENKGPIMPVERAIQIAEDSGFIARGQITPATMNRILRKRQLSKARMKAPTPHTEMRSLHPNHVHEFDVSVCVQYYLKGGKMGIMDERDFYKNKPENFSKIKTRLLRYVLTDHFSGAFKFMYFNTSGESADNLWTFLKWAWGPSPDPRLPFRGVPKILMMDTGAANKSGAIVNFLRRLEVEIPKGLPYNPRRQGQVECTHNIIESWFESGLRLQPAFAVEDLNHWALDFSIWHQADKVHTRHGMQRTLCWLMIKADQLWELPDEETLQYIYANPEEQRTVENYRIPFKSKEYNLKHIDGIFNGAKVQVIMRPRKMPAIDISYQGRLYEVEPIEKLPAIQGGFSANAAIIGESYRANPETETQRAVKRMDNMAYGEEKKKDAVPFEGLRVFGHHADKVPVDFITRQGTPIEVEREITREIPIVEFFKRLKNEIGVISPELNQTIRSCYGSTIDIAEAEEVIRGIQEGTWPARGNDAMQSIG